MNLDRTDIEKNSKKVMRDTVMVFGAIMVSTGLVTFLPEDVGPAVLIVGGIIVTAGARQIK
ncbi:hypothetical protein [Methanolobus sp. WCC4]|uniref:hypothetical protein n=1 Tax=Methanolobus sp. WCC4 TaxID=3125784 RepID=UPI0030F6A737